MALPQKRNKSYDMNFKSKAVEVAEKKSKEVATCEVCIDPKRTREMNTGLELNVSLE